MYLPLLLPVLLLSIPQNPDPSVLDVEISNIRNKRGNILISVYFSRDEYPYHPLRTYVVSKSQLAGGLIKYEISDLKPGVYGMALLDDEDNSGGMNYNFLGLPAEGFAFANNVKPFLKNPDYEKVLFPLKSGKNQMKLIVRYKT